MDPFVDLEVFRPGKDLSTTREGAGEGLLTSVDSDVVHQLILGLEGSSFSGAILPIASMV